MFHKERYKIGAYFVDARRCFARGRTIILIHGIGVSGNYFMPFAKILSQNYDVHILDMPGYGATPKPAHPLTPFAQADIVARYMERLGIDKAIIVGQSMGCQTAAQLAARHPSLCEKLVLIGPTVNKWERRRFLQALRLLGDTFREPFRMNLIILHDYLHMGLPAYWVTTRYMIADHIEDTLKRVTIPVCIARGEKDGIAPKEWAEYLGKVAKDAEVHHIKDGPHNIQFSSAKELFVVCRDFLSR